MILSVNMMATSRMMQFISESQIVMVPKDILYFLTITLNFCVSILFLSLCSHTYVAIFISSKVTNSLNLQKRFVNIFRQLASQSYNEIACFSSAAYSTRMHASKQVNSLSHYYTKFCFKLQTGVAS